MAAPGRLPAEGAMGGPTPATPKEKLDRPRFAEMEPRKDTPPSAGRSPTATATTVVPLSASIPADILEKVRKAEVLFVDRLGSLLES